MNSIDVMDESSSDRIGIDIVNLSISGPQKDLKIKILPLRGAILRSANSVNPFVFLGGAARGLPPEAARCSARRPSLAGVFASGEGAIFIFRRGGRRGGGLIGGK